MSFPQGDLFGRVEREPRGWSELDKARREVARLERLKAVGEWVGEQLAEARRLLAAREREAQEKWKNSFGG